MGDSPPVAVYSLGNTLLEIILSHFGNFPENVNAEIIQIISVESESNNPKSKF